MTGWAYGLALIVYNVGGLITGELGFTFGTVVGFLVIALLIYLLFRKGYDPEKAGRTRAAVQRI